MDGDTYKNLFEEVDFNGNPKKTIKNYFKVFRIFLSVLLLKATGLDLIMREVNKKLRLEMTQLRSDMKTLYSEISTDTRRELKKIGNIKPVLKIEDPEAVKFIKDILSTHDKKTQTQQEFLEMKRLQLVDMENKINCKLLKMEELHVNLTEALRFNSEDKKEG